MAPHLPATPSVLICVQRNAVRCAAALCLACAAPSGAEAQTVVQGAVPASAPVLSTTTIARQPGWSFSAVATADVDRDGRRDVIALDRDRRGVVVARSRAGGRFLTRRHARIFRLNVGEQLAVGDLDRDGRPDLVTTGTDLRSERLDLRVQVAFGTRSGFSCSRSAFVLGGERTPSLAVGDVDGDRRPDVMLGLDHPEPHRGFRGDGVVVMRSRPGRRFAARSFPTAARGGEDRGGGPPELLTDDLDRDGALDIVFRGGLMRGLGRGRFAPPVRLAPRLSDVSLSTLQRLLVVGDGRTDVLAASKIPPHNANQRLGVVARGTRTLRRTTTTRLQPVTDDSSVWIGGQATAGRLRDGPGYDVVFSGGGLLWLASTADGTRFGAAVPTIVAPGTLGRIAVADVTGDRRDEVIATASGGRLLLVRAARPQPLAQPLLPPSAPFIAADGLAYPLVSCRPGAGACIGRLRTPDKGFRPLRLAPGASVHAPILLDPAPPVGLLSTLRWESPLLGAETQLRLIEPTPADTAAACAAPPGTRVLARPTGHSLIYDRDYVSGLATDNVVICSTATGGRTPLGDEESSDVIAPPIAAFDQYVATLRDICPGGFEGCIAGLEVLTVPDQRTVSAFTVGDGVDAVAVGVQGALVWIQCPYAAESDPTCDGGPYTVFRLDARGRRRVGGGMRIDPRTLRASADGLSFSWRDAGLTRSARWSGAPLKTLPDPPDE